HVSSISFRSFNFLCLLSLNFCYLSSLNSFHQLVYFMVFRCFWPPLTDHYSLARPAVNNQGAFAVTERLFYFPRRGYVKYKKSPHRYYSDEEILAIHFILSYGSAFSLALINLPGDAALRNALAVASSTL